MKTQALRFFGLAVVLSLVLTALALPVSATPPGQGDVTIEDVMVTQVFGKQYNDAKDFVAGKDTVVIVRLSAPVAPDSATQKVVVKRDGTEFTPLSPAPSAEPTQFLIFAPAKRSDCGDWQKGVYSFVATVGNATKTVDGLQFIERRTLRILALPVKANFGGGKIESCSGLWKQGGEFMKQIYPVSAAGFNWSLGQEFDASGTEYDLTTDPGRQALWIALASMQPKDCANNPTGANCYDLIIGFVPHMIDLGGGRALQGYTYGAPANIVGEADQDMLATVAHEVAHVYKVGDEYDKMNGAFQCEINPPPPTYVGRNWTGEDTNFSCKTSTEVPFPVGTGSLVSTAQYFPYEVGGRGPLPDSVSFMGSGAPQAANWNTPRVYAYLFKTLTPTGSASAGTLKLATHAQAQRFIYATGFVLKDPADKVELDPWYDFEDADPFQQEKGAYSIEALDKDGKVLASQGFDVSFFARTNPPTDLAKAPFEVALPFPEETAKFVVKHGDKVIAERVVSANAPTVDVITPKADETVDGEYTITWKAEDADGDKMWFDVEYSPNDANEESFIYLATGLTEPKWKENFKDLPGGERAVIRIWATDGVNTTEATSDPFNVTPKPPEVFIDEPADGATFEEGTEVALSGSAYDIQADDWIAGDDQLTWSSDKDGDLGTSELLYVEGLSKGTHTITLKAKDSRELTAQVSIKINIVEKGAAPKPTTAPVAPTKAPEPTKAPVATKAPEPTKAAEPTKAPEPTKAAPTAVPTPVPAKGPCGSIVLALLPALLLMAFWFLKRKA